MHVLLALAVYCLHTDHFCKTFAMSISIQHLPEQACFQALVDGHVCLVEYALHGNVMHIVHTLVPQAVGGRGVAGEMTHYALEAAQANGWKVRAVCSYTAAYVKRHAQYQALLA